MHYIHRSSGNRVIMAPLAELRPRLCSQVWVCRFASSVSLIVGHSTVQHLQFNSPPIILHCARKSAKPAHICHLHAQVLACQNRCLGKQCFLGQAGPFRIRAGKIACEHANTHIYVTFNTCNTLGKLHALDPAHLLVTASLGNSSWPPSAL